MKNHKKIFITAALTGAVHTPSMSPYLPVTTQQLIDEAAGPMRRAPQWCTCTPATRRPASRTPAWI